jgi:hypothetical protein
MDNNLPTLNHEIGQKVFAAPRELLNMYQKVSFSGFKVWACLLADISAKNFSDKDQFIPLNEIWQALDRRLTYKHLGNLLDELQTTVIKREEFLPQTRERKISSFQLLGPSEITVDESNEVNSLQYRIVSELSQLLKDSSNQEQFLIELRTFISLKGKGGEHAKNLLLFCTPYVSVGETPFIELDELRLFMGLKDHYVDEHGKTEYKYFKRDVLRKGIVTLTENPYVDLTIKGIKESKTGGKVTKIKFLIEERSNIKNLLSDSCHDISSPNNPNKVRTMLISFWTEYMKKGIVIYSKNILVSLLEEFKLVESRVNSILSEAAYELSPEKETYRIFSISTAIMQLWIEGKLTGEDSKIYNYAYTVFQNPKNKQIDSLCNQFIISAGLVKKTDTNIDANEKAKARENEIHSAKSLKKYVAKYDRESFKALIAKLSEEQQCDLDNEFVVRAKANKCGPWVRRAVENIDRSEPLVDELPRRTSTYYKHWITERAVDEGILPERNIEDFLEKYPNQTRHVTLLNIPLVNFTITQLMDYIKPHLVE